jgi:hypothetical protein
MVLRYIAVFGFLLAHLAAGPLSAQERTPAEQIEAAVLAAPASLRADATVLGYGGQTRAGDVLSVLREGDGPLICLADDPAADGFHVACYHESLDPYMALGRRLRAEGRNRGEVMDARFAALESGEWDMPRHAALYSLTAAESDYDPSSGKVHDAQELTVVYVPEATGAELGLPTRPEGGLPWLMLAGTPWAHIMISK